MASCAIGRRSRARHGGVEVRDIAVVTGAASGIGAAATSLLVAQGTPVVAVASVNALQAEQGLVAYNASKAALVQLIRTVAVDHAREGIRANVVCPGVTETALFRAHLATANDPVRFRQVREQRNPLGRL